MSEQLDEKPWVTVQPWVAIQKKLDTLRVVPTAFKMAVFQLIWSCCCVLIFSLFGAVNNRSIVKDVAFSDGVADPAQWIANIGLARFLVTFALAMAAEELLFRIIPLILAIEIGRKIRDEYAFWIIATTILVSSFIFGYAHGNLLNVFVQGVSGLLTCLLFLALCGFRRQYLRASIGCYLEHVFYNTIACGMYFLSKVLHSTQS